MNQKEALFKSNKEKFSSSREVMWCFGDNLDTGTDLFFFFFSVAICIFVGFFIANALQIHKESALFFYFKSLCEHYDFPVFLLEKVNKIHLFSPAAWKSKTKMLHGWTFLSRKNWNWKACLFDKKKKQTACFFLCEFDWAT